MAATPRAVWYRVLVLHDFTFLEQRAFRRMATCESLRPQNAGVTGGVFGLQPRGPSGVTVPVYCDFGQSPAGQSLFDVPSGEMAPVGQRLCGLQRGNDDMDSTLMWVNFEGRIAATNDYDVRTLLSHARELLLTRTFVCAHRRAPKYGLLYRETRQTCWSRQALCQQTISNRPCSGEKTPRTLP